jgi:hypothetical protein
VDQRRLRGLVEAAADPAVGDQAADRGDVDDAPLAPRKHGAADDLGAEEAVREVEIDELLPGLEIGVLDGHVEIAPAYVVDEDVDRPGLCQHALAEFLAQRGLGDVAGKGPGLAPALAHLGGGPRQGVCVARVQHDVGAGLGRRQRNDPAEAAAAAGHEHPLAIQPEAIEHVHGTTQGAFLPSNHING